jgi:hypothetical protein
MSGAHPAASRPMRNVLKITLLLILVVFIAPALVHAALWLLKDHPKNWHTADWSSAGTLPSPRAEPEASIRVMAARTGGLKGAFSVHTWLVLKRRDAPGYDRYDVVGWGNPVRRNAFPPDGRWYSNPPVPIFELKGAEAERLLPKVEAAIRDYQWGKAGAYRIWPGPNSNTFVAIVLAAVPELQADLPSTAVGRDYHKGPWLSRASGGGYSMSIAGLAGLTIGAREGIQVNFLGLVAGIRFRDPAILLPGFGALGGPF